MHGTGLACLGKAAGSVYFCWYAVMQSALGIMGTEGTFRAAAEGTLHAMRSSSTAQSELLLSHCQEASLVWNAGHHESALSKVQIFHN